MQPVTKKKGDHAMSNSFEMKCPKCGNEDRIDIHAAMWVRLTSDGTDADTSACGEHVWCADSMAACRACDYNGTVNDFEPPAAEDTINAEMVAALELCADALGELARLDDGTPSISALHLARAALEQSETERLMRHEPGPPSGGPFFPLTIV